MNFNLMQLNMNFNFKEALEKIQQPETTEERIEYFLQSIIVFIRSHNINIKDIDEIQFSIRKESETPPLLYGVYASYTLKENMGSDEKYHQINCLSGLEYPDASLFVQLIEDELTKEGYNYKRDIFDIGDERYEKYKMRDCSSIKL